MSFIYKITMILITGIVCYMFSIGITGLEKMNIRKQKGEPKHNKIMLILTILLLITIVLSVALVSTYIDVLEGNYYITSSISMLYIFISLKPLLDTEEKYKISRTFKMILYTMMSLYVIALFNIVLSAIILFF